MSKNQTPIDLLLTFENSVFAETFRYEGFMKGEKAGLEQGLFDKLLIALRLKRSGLDNHTIVFTTNLTHETFKKIQALDIKYGEEAEKYLKSEFNLKFVEKPNSN